MKINYKTIVIALTIIAALIGGFVIMANNNSQRLADSAKARSASTKVYYALLKYDGSITCTTEKEKKGNKIIVTYYADDSYTRGKYGSKLLVITYDKNYKVKNVEGNEILKKVAESSID